MDQNEEDEELNNILKKHYFSIDINSMSSGINQFFSEMLYGSDIDDALHKQLNNFADAIFASFGNDGIKDSVIFIGNNSYGEAVFKPKHFIVNRLYREYLNHIRSHASYVLRQPDYYKNLHEILN